MIKVNKGRLILDGLDCASCAVKIEDNIKKIDGVSSASLNFASKTLTVSTGSDNNIDEIMEKASRVIEEMESQINIIEEGKKEEHDQDYGKSSKKIRLIRIIVGTALFFATIVLNLPFWVEFSMFLASYMLVGGEVVFRAVKNLVKGRIFDENFLMSIATLGAFAIREFSEAVAVMLFYQLGELLQNVAVDRSRKSIAALMDIRPDFANLKTGNRVKRISPEQVNIGDIIIIKPGEKVPLDGTVCEGESMLDTSAITGEPVPREVKAGSPVLSGSINKHGLLSVKVEKEFGESTVSKILDLVQNASSKKAPTENFITKFARYYTPFVVFIALALAFVPPLFIPDSQFQVWINRALVFLVVSCPCALVISIPLGFFGGIGGASRKGILIKGSNYLEALNHVDTVVFDKTGTLTEGVFQVVEIMSSGSLTEDQLLEYAAYTEGYSNHPIALSIRNSYGKEVDKGKITEYEELSGHGVKASINGKKVLAGNRRLMEKEKIPLAGADPTGTMVHIAIDGEYAGYITIADKLKDDSKKTTAELKAMGVRKLVMLTGDSKQAAEKIGGDLQLDEVYAGLLPHQKVEMLEMLERKKPPKSKLVFMGDGINDAPVLARADIGVAMGALGSDAAIEAADIVLMTDEPSKLVGAIKTARRTRRIVWQNIIFAMAVKAVVLILGAGGIAGMWEAVFADVGVSVLAVLNAMRIIRPN